MFTVGHRTLSGVLAGYARQKGKMMASKLFDQAALTAAVVARDYDTVHAQVAYRDGDDGPVTHAVTRDGVEKFRGTEKQCGVYLHRAQNMSTDWAIRYEGWAVQPAAPRVPCGGDAVRLTAPWGGLQPGVIGVLDGPTGQPTSGRAVRDGASITFNAHVYRDGRRVSCSGGPGTIQTPFAELTATDETYTMGVWRFKNGYRAAGNAEEYTVTVPVWEWSPAKEW